MIPNATEVRLTPEDRATLEAWLRAKTNEQRMARRSRIVLLAADGLATREIARQVGVRPRIVSTWRQRFAAGGIDALADKQRPCAKPVYGEATNTRMLTVLDQPVPKGRARWTCELVSAALGDVDVNCVRRFLRAQKIDQDRRKSWCESNDPEFASKALLEAVLLLAALTIDVLVEEPGAGLPVLQRGDHEARVGLAVYPLRLGDHAARARPPPARLSFRELAVAARRLAGAPERVPREHQLALDCHDEARIARQPDHTKDAVFLAHAHKVVGREAAVRPQKDLDLRSCGADPSELLDGSVGSITVDPAQLCGKQIAAAEHVQRQIATAVVEGAEGSALLLPVDGIVRRIHVERQTLRRFLPRLDEKLQKHAGDGLRLVAEPAAAAGRADGEQLNPVERRLAGQRRTFLAPGRELAGERGEHWIVLQPVVVVKIIVAAREAEDALAEQRLCRCDRSSRDRACRRSISPAGVRSRSPCRCSPAAGRRR